MEACLIALGEEGRGWGKVAGGGLPYLNTVRTASLQCDVVDEP